jgi:hypothetical protein
MRTSLLASAFLIAGYVVLSSASCSSSSTSSGGGAAGNGGAAGSGGAAGAGGAGGGGGSTTDSGSISPTNPELTALGFNSACNTCIASMCGSDFTACEANSECKTALTCIAACYLKTGNLMTCAETTCAPDGGEDTDSGAVGLGHDAVFCIAMDCGTASTCMVAGM